MHSYKKAVKESTTERWGRGDTREDRAGIRDQGHKLDNYRNKEVGSPRGRRKRPFKSALVNLQYFLNPWGRKRKPNQSGMGSNQQGEM